MRNEFHFAGCRTAPLGSYLKGLGVLRLVSEQLDDEVRGHWGRSSFVLSTKVTRQALEDFFLDEYAPTPLVAPWNNGSGLSPKGTTEGIEAIMSSTADRLASYRSTIALARELYDEGLSLDLKNQVDVATRDAEAAGKKLSLPNRLKGEIKKDLERRKPDLVSACRSRLDDQAVAWIDAAIVLTSDGLKYPPILGSGGNLGNLELSNNFMQRLADALCLREGKKASSRSTSQAWLQAALFDEGSPPLVGKAAIGQFDPGGAGGVRATPVGQADSLVNPWDFVLLFEGSLVFASAAARRLGGGRSSKAAMPFTVNASAVGYASSAADEKEKGELWAPVWEQPAAYCEIERLLGEGRATWNGRQARDGLDMVKAVTTLGVDRGIHHFKRYAFVERHGQNPMAVPVGEVRVVERSEVGLLLEVEPWVDRLRRGKEPPAGVLVATRRLERAMFDLARRGGPAAFQEVLVCLAEAEHVALRSKGFRDREGLRPLANTRAGHLMADEWLPLLDDDTPELRLASALAFSTDRHGKMAALDTATGGGGSSLRDLLLPTPLRDPTTPPRIEGGWHRPIHEVLADALVWRSRQASGRDQDGNAPQPGFDRGVTPREGDTTLLAMGLIEEQRLGRLLHGLLVLRPPRSLLTNWRGLDRAQTSAITLPALQLLAPFYHAGPLFVRGEAYQLTPQPEWAALLRANRVAPVITDALLRLRMARLHPGPTSGAAMAADVVGPRLAAALLCPSGRRHAQSALLSTLDLNKGEDQ